MDQITTSANLKHKASYEMCHGMVASLQLFPFLEPSFYRRKREIKDVSKAPPCFYLRPARNHPRDAVRILDATPYAAVIVRNITWLAFTPPLSSG